ncbi:MAG TPA: response regulator, partial [Candidatus Brocadiia bacterium]|nr:response regulator [Candidatus Brocadiia bacterium]
MTEPLTLLVIDDEPAIRRSIRVFFEDAGFLVLDAPDGQTGLDLFRQRPPNAVLVDLQMPGLSGIEVIRAIAAESPGAPLIVLSGASTIQDAIHAVREDAWDYVTKPIADMAEVEIAVQRGLERARLLHNERRHREDLEHAVAQRTRELTEATNRLAASEARLRLLFENVSDIITVLDPNGVIVFETPSVERYLGYTPQERMGSNVFDYVHPADVRAARDAFTDVVAGGARRIEVRL